MTKKHTSLYIDEQLLAEAERLLSTSGPTETVNRALTMAVVGLSAGKIASKAKPSCS